MNAIWKYPLGHVAGGCVVQMPKGAKVLSVQYQGDTLTLWALVDPTAEKHERVFLLEGTGWTIHEPDRLTFIGTVQEPGAPFVWHIFEEDAPHA